LSIDIVIGGHYGSEGKGSVVSWMAQQKKYDLVIRTGGPNAGHSFLTGKPGDKNRVLYKMRQLPCSWAFQDSDLYIPAAGLIDPEVLVKEMHWLMDAGYKGTLHINSRTAVIVEDAKKAERSISSGTTGEGIGATRAAKCMRQVALFKDFTNSLSSKLLDPFQDGITEQSQIDSELQIERILKDSGNNILIETTQGFGLSLNGKHYPNVTSTDLDTYHLLGDAEIPYGVHDVKVWLVIRTFPIRISGKSGFLFNETTWENLRSRYGAHIPDEFTTVTNKMRRVGEFDHTLTKDAIRRCGPKEIILTFFDYVFPNFRETGWTKDMFHYLSHLEAMIDAQITYVGVGIGEIEKVPPSN
jgi:adenylosuccinate synthase